MKSRGKITHTHIYRDKQGDPCYMMRRYEDSSASYHRYIGGWFKRGLGGMKRILYNLPDVMRAGVVLIVEGEKKADILTALNLRDGTGKAVAVTTTGGADSWRIEHVEYLRGKRVLLLPDTDDPGIRYGDAVEASLERAGIESRTVYFNEYGKDFREFLKCHPNPDDFVNFIGSPWLVCPSPEPDIVDLRGTAFSQQQVSR